VQGATLDLTLILLEMRCADGFAPLCLPAGEGRPATDGKDFKSLKRWPRPFLEDRARPSIAFGAYGERPNFSIFFEPAGSILPAAPKEKI
jgi:hypothetical protein